jgi:hypothetical protein
VTAYSLENKIAKYCTGESKTLSEISDAVGASPSVVLATLRWMVSNRQMLRVVNEQKARAEFMTILKPDDAKDIVVHEPNPPKKPIEAAPSKKELCCDHGVNLRVYCADCDTKLRTETAPKKVAPPKAVSKPETTDAHNKPCKHGTPAYKFCNDCFRAANNMDGQKDMCAHGMPNHGWQCRFCIEEKSKKEKKPVVQVDPSTLPDARPTKLDRRGAEFKAEKRKLVRPHSMITEISAELKANGTVSIYEILPDSSKPNGILVNQEFNIPVECINALCEALQSLRQLHKRYEG